VFCEIQDEEDNMTLKHIAVSLLLCVSVLGGQLTAEQALASDQQSTIIDTIEQMFNEIAVATNALDFDRLLGQYKQSEDLTYVARGRVTRGFDAFSQLVYTQFRGVTEANLLWNDIYIDVFSDDVAAATATYQLVVTLESGDTFPSSGTFVCIYILDDKGWKIQHSAHTFPPTRQ
jgi:ketosteroid isomerase-like protein